MHIIDEAIISGTLTSELLAAEADKPLPPAGTSYWSDHRRAGLSPLAAAKRAARDMGQALASLASVS